MIERICQQCGATFKCHPSQVGKFCSRLCANQYLGKVHKGRPRPPEVREKISLSNKGKVVSAETRQLLSKSHKGKCLSEEHKHNISLALLGPRNQFYGKKHSKESKERMSEAHKLVWQRPGYSLVGSSVMKRVWQRKEYREQRKGSSRKASLALWENPEYRKKVSEGVSRARKREWQNPEYRVRRIHPQSQETRQKISETHKDLWQCPQFVKKMMLAFHKKPTKPELKLEAILKKHFPQYQYNGDGRLGITLGGLTPDFPNVNGKKDLIELFGDYYHSPKVLRDRWQGSELGKIMIYNSVGWRCLVIWEHELKELTEEEIVAKIKSFHRRKYARTTHP